ncbi:HAD-IA family hydrolase [Brachybacterium sp. EF45031]|uniref:HAD-IA family hydrolase n=1 Tax=Brachybacterium sillae TaxID=2810536 RepID=UPI00217D7652|nr:HAD-IA family hydrolase [Brachybacterium sillae]MCS6712362.1 HAD-IA family hydrolase [Brachybacterium sillae]
MTSVSGALDLTAAALLLDMDGTLVDSGDAVVRSWNRLFQELGSAERFDHRFHGTPARGVLRRVFPDMDDAEMQWAFTRIEDLEVADVDEVHALPGTEDLLAALDAAARDLDRPTWTIVTSCTQRLFAARWARTGLPVPDGLITADEVHRGKPDPEPYLRGAAAVGIAPEHCLVVEDSVGGLEAGRGAGCRTLAITTTTPAEALAPGADAVIDSLVGLRVSVEDDHLRLLR